MPEAWLTAALVAARQLPLSKAARVARFSWAAAGGDAAIDFAVAPVVARREPLSTVGLGDAISATGLAADFATRRRAGSTITQCGREGKGNGRVRHVFARAFPTPRPRRTHAGASPAPDAEGIVPSRPVVNVTCVTCSFRPTPTIQFLYYLLIPDAGLEDTTGGGLEDTTLLPFSSLPGPQHAVHTTQRPAHAIMIDVQKTAIPRRTGQHTSEMMRFSSGGHRAEASVDSSEGGTDSVPPLESDIVTIEESAVKAPRDSPRCAVLWCSLVAISCSAL